VFPKANERHWESRHLVNLTPMQSLKFHPFFYYALVAILLSSTGLKASAQGGSMSDPRGPIHAPGIHPQLTSDGVEDPDFTLKGTPIPTAQPEAEWVWLGPQFDQNPTAVVCFRKEIVLKAAPVYAKAWVSADQHYRLWINGALASRGPADPGADYPGGKNQGGTGLYYCDYRNLTPFFHRGTNIIAIEVFPKRLSEWYGSSGHPGLFFQGDIRQSDKATLSVKTDQTWRGTPGGYWETVAGMLTYFAAKEPAGWRGAGFDDRQWPQCAPAGSHWPHLRTSRLPPPMEMAYPALRAVRVSPSVSISDKLFSDGHGITVSSDGAFTLQYPRILSGYVGLRVRGGAGATLTLGLNEMNSPGGHRSAAMVLTGGTQYFETPFYSSFTFVNITASHVTSPIQIEDITAGFVSNPLAYRGRFSCSDKHWNEIWNAARWATQICLQDHHLDSPDHQEPICDPGDYLIEALNNYYAFDQPSLTQQDLRKFGALLAENQYINFHTSYSLLWLQMLLDYYDYTGDAALVKELTPNVYGLLDKFAGWVGKNGLISEAPDYMFMDWVDIAGIPCHHPPAVIGQGYMTAFYYRALADGIRVARLNHDTPRILRYEQERKDVSAAFNRELWNPKEGLYRDGKPFQTSIKPNAWLPPDTDIETFSPHVNTLAVLYDLAPTERQAAILSKVMAAPPVNCQPYFYHFVFNALAHCGLFDTYAPREMTRWRLHPDTHSFREMWDRGDWSHAWGGTPLYQLSSKVLGVTPAQPGYRRVAIRPTLGDLQWAKGAVPTPQGDVEVSWSLKEGGMQMTVTVPHGTEGEIVLPLDRFPHAIVTMNGHLVPKEAKGGQRPISVHAGTYRFVVHRP
jgi:alpha-L-rhamnosidase